MPPIIQQKEPTSNQLANVPETHQYISDSKQQQQIISTTMDERINNGNGNSNGNKNDDNVKSSSPAVVKSAETATSVAEEGTSLKSSSSWEHPLPTVATGVPEFERINLNDDDDANGDDGSDNNKTWRNITKKDRKISKEDGVNVMKHAQDVLQRRVSEADPSKLDIFEFETSMPKFMNSEIELGRRIAWGNFADIYIINKFNATSKSHDEQQNQSQEQIQQAEQIKHSYTFNQDMGGSETLVVKVLRAQLLINISLYATGAADLVTEGTLLASLKHTNIVSIFGRSVPSVEGFASGKRDTVFLILERLEGNLNDKIKYWLEQRRQQQPHNNSSTQRNGGGGAQPTGAFSRIRGRNLQQRRDSRIELLRERVDVMRQLADAMTYLASMNIIHRDLKLSNIGIDRMGNVKLIDFGLAKILPPNHNHEKDVFQLTGNTGSIRYMAPEIGLNKKYNMKADVYSFSILLYEILNLGKVWQNCSADEVRQKVFIRKQRPMMSMFWPAPLKELIKNTWSDIPAARLSMVHIHTILSKYLSELSSLSTSSKTISSSSSVSENFQQT